MAAGGRGSGSVERGPGASVWVGVLIRGDNDLIRIGRNSNIQDQACLHSDAGVPLTLGDNVTIGHQVMLHGCTIGDNTLVGIQAVVLNRAKIGRNCIVGAGSIVTEGKEFPDYSLIVGPAARVGRTVDAETGGRGKQAAADVYVANAERLAKGLKKIG